MITIRNINKKFGKLSVLNDINLSFKKGQCIALIGPNGCGKTTLIKSILGMVIPNSGLIEFNGKSILGEYLYRENIGYMPQIGRYPDNMTIGQIIEMIKKIRNSNQELDEDLLKAFELEKMFDKQMRTLSGGTTQKVSAVLAFLFNPDVLILDEPTTGLDPITSKEIILLMNSIQKQYNTSSIIITHDVDCAKVIANRMILLIDGINYIEGTFDELASSTDPKVQAFFK